MFRNGINGYCNSVSWQVFFSQIKKAEQLFECSEEKSPYSDEQQIKRIGEFSREFFLQAIGQIPADNSELDAKIVGTVEYEHYRIDKVVYQSLENFYVTSNLYVPKNLDSCAPAILLCAGHAKDGKAYDNYRSAGDLFAKNGFIVLAFDPPGQGERLNLIDRKTGVQRVRWGTREHSWLGLICSLYGTSIARYFIRDAQRGIDFLTSLPEVDPSKIGVTGISGGGTQSSYLALVEDRIAAAAPGCYVTERLEYLKKFHAHDAEQNIFGHIPAGFNYCNYFIGFAPKPLLLQGVAYDFFPIEGLLKTYEAVQSVYKTLGYEKNCRIFIDDTIHGFSPVLRRETLKFFAEVFMDKKETELYFDESPAEIDDLVCTKSGQVLVDYPQAEDLGKKILDEMPKTSRLSGEELRKHIRNLICNGRDVETVYPRIISEETTSQDYQIEKMFFYSEQDIAITAELIKLKRHDVKRGIVIALPEDGTNALGYPDKISELFGYVGSDKNILILDVRGIGGTRISDSWTDEAAYRNMYGTLFKVAYNYWMLGDNFVACRAFDVLCALKYLRSIKDVDINNIEIYAEEDLAIVGLLAAVADGDITKLTLKGLPSSYRKEASKIYFNRKILNEWTVIHGMLRDFDIPELCKLVSECKLI